MKAAFKFAKIPGLINGKKPIVIDTTRNNGDFAELSPFVLRIPISGGTVIFENLWQYSKVYKEHTRYNRDPGQEWLRWRYGGFSKERAVRYPMGKGAVPEYSWWDNEKLGYIEARKRIYFPVYAKNVRKTKAWERLEEIYKKCIETGRELILLDYDAYDHQKHGMSLKDVINNPKKKAGHAFALMMMLTGELEECINSPNEDQRDLDD